MAPRTVFLAKLIGLCCVVFGLAVALQKRAMVDVVATLMRNGPVLLIVEAIAVTAGLAIVIGHNVWSGGALPVTCWAGSFYSVGSCCSFFASAKLRFFEMFRFPDRFYLYAGITLVRSFSVFV
jgi:hypothetical protein